MTRQEHLDWVSTQMAKAQPAWNPGAVRWEVACPACGDVLYCGRTASRLMQSLEHHLLSSPPFGLEHRDRQCGERLEIRGEWYKVAVVFRPYSNRYYHRVRLHTFQLALRRIRDGKLYRTSATQVGVIEKLARTQRKEFGL